MGISVRSILGSMRSEWDKYFYTVYLIFTTLAYGIIFSLFPNIMVDMKFIMETDDFMISLYQTLEQVGYILGTFMGLTYKYLNRQLVMGSCFTILTVTISVLPIIPNLPVLYVCAIINGFCSSVIMCSYTVWTIEMWGSHAAPVLYIEDFSYGIGSTIASAVLKPFVVGDLTDKNTNETTTTTSLAPAYGLNDMIYYSAQNNDDIDRRAILSHPFMIIGICAIPVPIVSLVMYFIKAYKPPESTPVDKPQESHDETHIEKLFDRQNTPRKWMRCLFIAWFTTYVLFHMEFLKYGVTYFQYSPLELPAPDAVQIMTVASAIYTAFTGVNAFLTPWLGINAILRFHYGLVVVAAFVLIGGMYHVVALWVASVIMLWGFSAMFAGLWAFTEQYITITNQMSTLLIMARGVFALFTPLILGKFIKPFSHVFIIIEFTYLWASIVLFIIIGYYIRKYKRLTDAN